MAALAASIADTVAGMQRVISRDEFSSDSDEPYLQTSNRGNKLKRKAHFLSDGPGGRTNGPKALRKFIYHAGFTREILRKNPKRFDEDGDELPSDEEDEEADARAAEENPYAEIKLETLLAPLTAASRLSNHPSLIVSYTSTTLSNITNQAGEMAQRERKTMRNAKQIMTKLRGDETWIPTGALMTEYDDDIFDTSRLYQMILASLPTANIHISEKESLTEAQNVVDGGRFLDVDHQQEGHRPEDGSASTKVNGASTSRLKSKSRKAKASKADRADAVPPTEKAPKSETVESIEGPNDAAPDPSQEGTGEIKQHEDAAEYDAEQLDKANAEEKRDEDMASPPRRITRAQANAEKTTASSRSVSPESWGPPPIHPLFLLPPSARPDSDFGLPDTEAEETRRLLAAYVQKQEEVCRGAEKLYQGLLEAERLRENVFKWCKADGHVGEMSDGEDWYDKEEWGLDDDLKKGHVEEEEDTMVQGKKTRGRRA